MPNKPNKVSGIPSTSKKTTKVPKSAASPGGTPYHQAKLGKGFVALPPQIGRRKGNGK